MTFAAEARIVDDVQYYHDYLASSQGESHIVLHFAHVM
jgi:hypothetical protein